FSIPTGGSATFKNKASIENIINRVTGGNISNIDGLIKASGNANLFLINPNGIVFGENASLNIGGSFIGSTAESILFEDGFNYSAIVSEKTPLLTVSVPLGLQMGTNPGDIIVNNTGHQLTGSSTRALTNQDPSIVGLQVPSEQTFALVGGNLKLNGGILTAQSGRFELSAIGNQNSSSLIGIQMNNSRPSLTYDTVQPTGNIQLLQQALVNASGTGSGTIQIHGENLTVEDGSVVWLENRGQQAAGSININIANSIDLIGTVPDGQLGSGIFSDVSSTGKGGNLTVNSRQIKLVEGGDLQARTFGDGDSGNVTLNASNIEFIDSKSDFVTGVIGTRSSGSFGNSGDVTVNTQSLSINGGGAIVASNASVSGNSGNVIINASDFVKLSVFASNSGDAIIGASAISPRGNAGNITINTPRLSLEGGALISSSTFGAGNSGTITVNASDSVSLSGTHFSPTRGILEGSAIRTAGVLIPSSISSLFGLPNQVTGSAGNVIINTPKLSITDGAEVFVRHDSVGNAGKLKIDADLIVLDGEGSLSASTKFGKGGNINIQSDFLNLRNQSQITATAGGTGNGGNITINSPVIAGFENSDIIANAVEGMGGNINIKTQGLFGLQFAEQLTSESDITASSEFGINGTVEINNVNIDPSSGLVELPVELTDSSQQIAQGCSSGSNNSFVVTGKGGIPKNPNQYLISNQYWSDIRYLSVSRKPNNNTENTLISNKPAIIEATGFIRNSKGEIELVALENTP
ncbi:MAG: S-layer family protein, partial [Cyanobacteria bacterium J06641_2]